LTDKLAVQEPQIRRIGVIGGGQLAWMMGPAAQKLGLELHVQTPQASDPAGAIAASLVLAPVDDVAATAALVQRCQVITFENEFVDLPGLQPLAESGVVFAPALSCLAPLLDKLDQRDFLNRLGLPTPRYLPLGKEALTDGMLSSFGFPVVLKTRRHGYDGKGTHVLPTLEALRALLSQVNPANYLLEEYVPFERELAVMAARGTDGQVVVYPVVETQQENQVCRVVIAPAAVSEAIAQQVADCARRVLEALQVVGIFGFELFLAAGPGAANRLLINELAPRTHNSGHYSLDACVTSQFEQQLRAVSGLPLGSPNLIAPGAVMVNLLGYETARSDYAEQRHALAAIPGTRVWWYGKPEARPGRKLGHVTVLLNGPTPAECQVQARAIARQIDQVWITPCPSAKVSVE
jgi:5-(carboxyamino)imidazole ribonucleotide synthase